MSRWEPDARGRLQQAALELYSTKGFDQTTVAEIAARADLTERTFFRYFTDKREVLFWGAAALQDLFVQAVAGAPESARPIEAVAAALDAVAAMFEPIRDRARRRQAVIAANVELQERELIKLARLATAVAEALRRRGVADPTASLTAEAGIAVFKIAFERWANDSVRGSFSKHAREALEALSGVTKGGGDVKRASSTAPAPSKRKARPLR
jgi:AcrR family transcriptional regulator